MPPSKPPEDELTQILTILQRMEKRDRWRTIGGFIRSVIGMIPIAIAIFLTWYTIKYGDQLLQKITTMAAQQAGKVAQQNMLQDFVDQFNTLNQKR